MFTFLYLFIKIPHQLSPVQQRRLNYLEHFALSAGFPCLDLLKELNGTSLDLQRDFFDTGHTNIHGSIKITHFLGQYLIDHYAFSDRRSLTECSDWEIEAERYMDYLKPYVFPFEIDHPERVDIAAPELNAPEVDGQNVLFSWKSPNRVDGVEVYRSDGSEWVMIADLPDSTQSLSDHVPKPSGSYSYTVVPYRLQGEKKLYGRFDVHGVSITMGGN